MKTEYESDTCGKPTCPQEASKTYRDDNGNAIRLCEQHYYSAVVGSGYSSGYVDMQYNVPDHDRGGEESWRNGRWFGSRR